MPRKIGWKRAEQRVLYITIFLASHLFLIWFCRVIFPPSDLGRSTPLRPTSKGRYALVLYIVRGETILFFFYSWQYKWRSIFFSVAVIMCGELRDVLYVAAMRGRPTRVLPLFFWAIRVGSICHFHLYVGHTIFIPPKNIGPCWSLWSFKKIGRVDVYDLICRRCCCRSSI